MNFLTRVPLESVVIVAILMFFGVAGAIPGIAPNQANEMTGGAATGLQIVVGVGSQLLVNAAIAGLLFTYRRLLACSLRNLGWPMLLAGWALLSITWSQVPLLTGRRAVPFALASGFGALLAVAFSQEHFLKLLRVSFALLAVWSAVLVLAFPTVGLDASTGHGGDWQGVFTQKNACGRAMVFALACCFSAMRLGPGRIAVSLLFGAELVLSGSRGAWGLALLVLFALAIFRVSCRFTAGTRTVLFLGTAVGVMTVAALVAINFADIAPLFGRDATLTGRTAIWHEVWLAILRRPWLGYGFSAFWRGTQAPSWDVVVALRFVLFHAHNGFLELWLELGAGGLLLILLGYSRAAALLWPELRAGRFAEAAWPASTLLLIALYDFDENTLLSYNGLFWVLYIAALVRIEVLARQRKTVQQALPRVITEPCAPHVWLTQTAPQWKAVRQAASHAAAAGSGPWL